MIPGAICLHYFPELRRGCDAGLSAPSDCHLCPAYADGSQYLGISPEDQARCQRWADLRQPSTPRAHFRGQGQW